MPGLYDNNGKPQAAMTREPSSATRSMGNMPREDSNSGKRNSGYTNNPKTK